jgi:hypothetical protein
MIHLNIVVKLMMNFTELINVKEIILAKIIFNTITMNTKKPKS